LKKNKIVRDASVSVALSPSALPPPPDSGAALAHGSAAHPLARQAHGSQWITRSQYPAAIDHVTMCHNVQPVAKCSQWHGFTGSTDVRHF
jgi:hypothetical protein